MSAAIQQSEQKYIQSVGRGKRPIIADTPHVFSVSSEIEIPVPTDFQILFKLYDKHKAFMDKYLPNATALGSLNKAVQEIKEAQEEIAKSIRMDYDLEKEFADVILCIFSAIDKSSIDIKRVLAAAYAKIEINEKREWVWDPISETYQHK